MALQPILRTISHWLWPENSSTQADDLKKPPSPAIKKDHYTKVNRDQLGDLAFGDSQAGVNRTWYQQSPLLYSPWGFINVAGCGNEPPTSKGYTDYSSHTPKFEDLPPFTIHPGDKVNFILKATDPDGDKLYYYLRDVQVTLSQPNQPGQQVPTNADDWQKYFDHSTHTFTYTEDGTLSLGESKKIELSFHVDDGYFWDNTTVTINVVPNSNQAPTINPIGNYDIIAGKLLEFTAKATDPDNDPLTFSAQNLPLWATLSKDGEFSWTPTDSQVGDHSITIAVSDGKETATADSLIHVHPATPAKPNQAPVLNPIGNKSVAQYSALTFKISATDPDNNPLTYSASGLPSGASFNTSTQTFSWTPNTSGTFSGIQFSVSDGKLSDSETISITVKPTLKDADGDGFKEDVDCDDNDPNTHPLPSTGISKSMNICEGTYNDYDLTISGNNITVKGLGWGVFLTGKLSVLRFYNLNNSNISSIFVLNSEGRDPAADIDPTYFSLFSTVILIRSSSGNTFTNLMGNCSSSTPSCVPLLLQNLWNTSTNNNIIQSSTFSNGHYGIIIAGNKNTVKDCTFSNNQSTDIVDDGTGTILSGNTFN